MENKLIPFEATAKIAGTRVIVLAPHPDDEVFGCGGAIMRHVADGDLVKVVIVSNGEYRADASQRGAYASSRQLESQKAALVLGYAAPSFWGIPDRGVSYGEPLVVRIGEAIGALNADLVYAPSLYEMHPDHRALGMAALEAVRRHAAQPRLAMYEVGVPMMRPNVLLDVSDLVARKQQAMECFASQLNEQAYDQHITALNRFRSYTLEKHVRAAEAYFVTEAPMLLSDLLGLYDSEYKRQRKIGLPMVPNDLPLVSVMVLSEERATLPVALDSIALQTYPNIEVIVVNAKGGGCPELGSLCGRFPMQVVSNCTGLRRSLAANLALGAAKGRYLIFLDDNARLEPQHTETLVTLLCDQPENKAACSKTPDTALGFPDVGAISDTLRLMNDSLIPIHGMLFDRCLVQAGCSFDETLDAHEDWDFELQIAQHTAFSHSNHIGAHYLTADGSRDGCKTTNTVRRQARNIIFEKWKSVWTGDDLDALLSSKEVLAAANCQATQSVNVTRNAKLKELEALIKVERDQSSHQIVLIDSLQRCVAETQASSSWRMTAPLRWVGNRIQTVKRMLRKEHP